MEYAYTVMSLMEVRREALDRKSKVLQNNLRLAGKDACESLLRWRYDRWIATPRRGLFLSEFDGNSIHRIVLTVPKAAVLSREWIQKKIIGVPMW